MPRNLPSLLPDDDRDGPKLPTRSRPRRFASVGLAATLAGLLGSGCSMSFPIPGFVDPAPTGAIAESKPWLSPALGKDDRTKAEAALAAALDPKHGSGKVSWHNPASGARGSFAAAARPNGPKDAACRAFEARLTLPRASERTLSGSACRTAKGNWVLRDVTDEQPS